MYQGLWQMCKLVLSDEAKAKVNFPKVQDLKILIEEEDLVAGKKDVYTMHRMDSNASICLYRL
jgi:hypothetical protein